MRNIITFLICCLLFLKINGQRSCGVVPHVQLLNTQDSGMIRRIGEVEKFTGNVIKRKSIMETMRSVFTIPVVVHVIYNTSVQNISDAQIQSQINVLNQDFRKQNADWTNTPPVYQGLAADCGIQFCLAQRDPYGNPTNGIIRKYTGTTAFGLDNAVKQSAMGGDDAWPRDSYLNIWVCNLGGSYLGYSTGPWDAAMNDGVVITYYAFGTTGPLQAPYTKGRTCTHEIGHWLNLIHIWGDDSGCTGTDNVDDTPNQGEQNFYCPLFPHISCNNGPNGDLFMNYMDYTNDECMFMFTAGQVARMQTLFAPGGPRAALLASQGGMAPNTNCATPFNISVSAITSSSATVSWGLNNQAGSYNLQFKPSASSIWNTVTTTNTNYSMIWLSASTAYDVRVQAVCSAGASNYSSVSSFTTQSSTPCGPVSGATATDITMSTVTITWNPVAGAVSYNVKQKREGSIIWSSPMSVGGNNSYYAGLTSGITYYYTVQAVCNGSISDYTTPASFVTLTSPAIAAPSNLSVNNIGSTSASVNWTAVSGAVSYNVQYKPSSSSAWNTINTASNTLNLTGLSSGTTYNVQVQSVGSSSTSAYCIAISFITTSQQQGCDVPGNVLCSNITANSAAISWTPVNFANNYYIFYRPSSILTWNTVAANTASITISGLNAGTSYDYKLFAACNTSNSVSTPVYTFITTSSTCNQPIGIYADSISQISAVISWSAVGGATGYNVLYKPSGSSTWNISYSSTPKIKLSGLTAGALYDIELQTVCSSGSSAYSTIYNFTTLQAIQPCNAPDGLSATGIGQNSATLAWNAVTGAISYALQFKASASATWSSYNCTATSYLQSGLSAGTSYDFKVQAICSSGSSIFSQPFSFTTAAAPVCNAPSALSTSGITTTSATLSWTAVSGAINYNIQYRILNDLNWTVLAGNTPYTLNNLTAGKSYEWRVQTVCSFGSSVYTASSTFSTAPLPVDTAPLCSDKYELNNSLSIASSISLANNIMSIISPSGDVDYFKFYNPSNTQKYIMVSLTGLPADYDLKLLKSSGQVIATAAHRGTVNEIIKFNKAAAGYYYVLVYGYAGANSVDCYTLNVQSGNVSFRMIPEEVVVEEDAEPSHNLYPDLSKSPLLYLAMILIVIAVGIVIKIKTND